MHQIAVSLDFSAPANRVFEEISAHETFLSAPGVSCRLLQEGKPGRDGLGAMREVASGKLTFVEEIIAFEPPIRFEYVIRELRLATRRIGLLRHERGSLELLERGGITSAHWRSRFEVRVPLLGGPIERSLGGVLARAFRRLLQQARRRIETSSVPATQPHTKSENAETG